MSFQFVSTNNRSRQGLHVLLITIVIISILSIPSPGRGSPASALSAINLPLSFIPNRGQAQEGVHFHSYGSENSFTFSPQEITLNLPLQNGEQGSLGISFLGANPAPSLSAGRALPGKVNILNGADHSGWYQGLPTYGDIHYQEIYPGIDLSYGGTDGRLKGTFTLAPGADPTRIRWRYQGAESVSIDPASGDLVIALSSQDRVLEKAPVAWQVIDGQRIAVPVSYAVAARGSLGFTLGAYNPALPLTIDPTIIYETTFSGANLDHGLDIAADAAGNAYVVAYAYTNNHAVLVAKLGPDGTLLHSTYLNGSAIDYGAGIAVDGVGGVYVTGWTDSANFPILNPLQGTLVGFRDAFLSRLSTDDLSLLYSTYLGGDYTDQAGDLVLNAGGEIYLVGSTWSNDFPTVDPIQDEHLGPPFSYADLFITKISADGQTILYSTYLGGYKDDFGEGIALDSSDAILIAGNTYSDDFPTMIPIQATNAGDRDGFVTRITPDGSALTYSTYLGGENSDLVNRLAVDNQDNAFVTGSTLSVGFPTTEGAYEENYVGEILGCEIPFAGDRNCYDMFVTKVSADGSALAYSTYLGGTRDDEARGIAVDSQGGAHVVGYTFSTDFPLSGECFGCITVSKLDPSGGNLLYTFVSQSGSSNAGHGIFIDDADATYFTGAGNVPADVYVAKITDEDPPYDTLHVADIRLRGLFPRSSAAIGALVTVHDQNGNAVEAAEVTISVTTALDPYRTFTKLTNIKGRALYRITSIIGGYWEVCVTDLAKDGYVYDQSQNVETCETINHP